MLLSSPGRQEAVSAHDRTMIAQTSIGTGEQTNLAAREARRSRPMLVVFTLVGYGWLAAGSVSAIADVLRWSRAPSGTLTYSESVLITIGVAVATLTPLALWVRYLRRGIWGNTLRSVQLSRQLRNTVVSSIAAYGIATLIVHLLEAVVQRLPLTGGQPALSSVLFALALLAGVVTWWREAKKRRPG
jgi:hypothetical protein